MARSKPRKKYTPPRRENIKLRARPDILAAVFFPIESILNQIENEGTIDTVKGVPVYKHLDGYFWELVPDFGGFVEAFAMKQYHYKTYDVTPLKQLLMRLEYDSPITQKEIDSARIALRQVHKTLQNLTLKEASELVKDAQIKFAFERRAMEKRG